MTIALRIAPLRPIGFRTVTAVEWVPLSRRLEGLGPEAPVEGVPKYLADELQMWLLNQFVGYRRLEGELRLRLRLEGSLHGKYGDELLDIVDGFLYWNPDSVWDDGKDDEEDLTSEQEAAWQSEVDAWKACAGEVEEILRTGGSAWRVNRRLDGLERRIDETVTAAVDMAARRPRRRPPITSLPDGAPPTAAIPTLTRRTTRR